MVIENVGGAGGTLGSARVAAARPDGYTLLAGSMGSHVAAPVLTPNVKYDSARDFEPIGLTANAPAVIVARKDFPAENLSEFVANLKANVSSPRANSRGALAEFKRASRSTCARMIICGCKRDHRGANEARIAPGREAACEATCQQRFPP
jgi:tripartite-type tricarboxylate transporter receptor subunit TctC